MGKISPVSSKYIVHASIVIDGIVDKPDVIGAIFGQTEGLLGADLELRELQRSGRIGRIEVNVDTKTGKSEGTIIIPSSLDKAETSIVAAALEIIQRIGPCNAKIRCEKIEDVRISKRNFVVSRAKELLRTMIDSVMPDSQEIADEVAHSVRVMEITEYGKERLPAGPAIEESEDVVVVEGRADVLNLLKMGIKNAIAMNGTSVPQTIIDLSRKKEVTVLVDGDRGGDLIVKQLLTVADIDFVSKAPDGKEIEELTKKEIHKTLRAKVSAEQAKLDLPQTSERMTQNNRRYNNSNTPSNNQNGRPQKGFQKPLPRTEKKDEPKLTPALKEKFKKMGEDLVGTRGAYIVDQKLNILGKVPITELNTTVNSLGNGIYAVIFDGVVDSALVEVAEKAQISYCIGTDVKTKGKKVATLKVSDL